MAATSRRPGCTIGFRHFIFFSRDEKHYIFFRELSSNAIVVLSILHGAMQIPVRLNVDLERISGKEEE